MDFEKITNDAKEASKEEKEKEELSGVTQTKDMLNDDSFLLPEMGDFYLGAVDTEYLKILDKKINGTTDEDASARRTAFCADTPPVLKAESKFDAGEHGLFLEIKPEFTEDIRESGVLDGRTLICSIDAIQEKSGIKANQDAFNTYREEILNQTKVSPDTYIKNKYIKFIINGLTVPSTSIWAVDHIHANDNTQTIKINGEDREARKLKDGTYKYLLKTGDVQQNINAEKRLEELINKNNGVLYVFVDKSQLGKINQISNENDKDSAIDFSQIDTLKKALLHISQDLLDALKNNCNYSPADFDTYIKEQTAFNFKNDKARNVNINPSKLFIGYFQNLGTESQVREVLNKFKDDNSAKALIQIVNNNFESEKSPVTGVANIGLDMHTLSGTAYFQTDGKWFNAGKYLLTAPGETEAKIAEPNTQNPYITNGYDIDEDQKYVDAFNSVFDELDDRYKIQKKLLGQDKYILNDWTVLLGDVLFMIPPETITMKSESSRESMPLLRAQNSMIRSNKDGKRTITLSGYFYGDKGINGFPYEDELPNGEKILYHMNGLRALLSQFKFTPYLPIENNLLNNVFDIHAVMINNINIQNINGIPRAVKVEMTLTEFDYNTYMPEITDLMTTLGISEKDRNYFSASINWKVFRYYYQRALINGNELAAKNFDYNSYQYIKEHLKNHTILQPMKFHNSTLRMYIADEDYLDMMMDQRMEDVFGSDGVMKPKTKDQWDELTKIGELGDAISKAAASSEWNKALKKYAEDNTDVDKNETPKQFETSKTLKTFDDPTKELLPQLKDTLMNLEFKNKDDIKDITYRTNQIFTDHTHETMLYRITMDIHLDKDKYPYYLQNKDVKNTVTPNDPDADNAGRTPSNPGVISVSYVAKYELQDKDNRSYKRISDFVLDTTTESASILSIADKYTTQKKYTDFDMNELEMSNDGDWKQAANIFNYSLLKYVEVNLPDLIVTDYQTIFSNNFATVNTLNGSGLSSQYMGGTSTMFNVKMVTNNKETASYLSRLSRTINLYEKKYRMILPCYPLKIESEITKLIDINDVLPHSIEVDTIKGSPGWYEINISMISVDRTLRQREAMSAIEGINSGWKERSWFQDEYKDTNLANFEMLKQVIGQVEVYPDLELPKVSELEKLGFKFTRYLFQDDRIYVDPDFYFVYLAPLTSQVLRESVLKLIKPDGLLNGDQTITDESGAQFDLIAKDGLGTSIQNMNDIAKEQQSQMNDAKEASKKIALKKLNENLKQAAHQKGQETNLDAWEVCKDIKTIFLERKYDKELKSNIARKKADEALTDNGPDSKIQAPNGKFFKQNDIDFLIKNKYTEEQAIALLSATDKYKKPPEPDTNNSLEKHNTESDKLEIQKSTNIKQGKDIFGNPKNAKKESVENKDNKDVTTSAHVQAEIAKEGKKITEGEWVSEQIEKSTSAANDFLYYLEQTPITLKDSDKILDITKDTIFLEKGKDFFDIARVNDKSTIYSYVKYWFEFDAVKALCNALYVNINDNFLSVVSDIIYAAACNATADKEYSSKQKATDWKPNSTFIAVINGLTQDASERRYADTVGEAVEQGLEFGTFRFKMYSQDAINNITSEENNNVATDNNKEKINSAMFVLDPYYRANKNAVPDYKLNCIVNTKFATIAYLRLVFYWLARLTQEYVYPSINSDVLRKTSVTELDIQNQYKKSGVSSNVDEQLLKNIEFFKKNEYQIDSGKIFVANLLTACDGDSKLLSRIKAKEYNALSSYQKGCVIPGKTINPNETSAMVFRKTIMALAGLGRIKDINTSGVSQDKVVNKMINTIYEKKYIEAAENVTTYASHACHDMIVYDARGRMLRAFPTFYMMLIDEGRDVGKWHLHDNYYNNNALGSIAVTRSKDNPVDVAEIEMSNFYGSFLLTGDDSIYPDTSNLTLMDAFADIVTPIVIPNEQEKIEERERKIKDVKPALRLVPGTKLTIKLGYGANPNLMPTVFNGVIAEVSAEDKIILQCSGYGQELINPILEDMEAYHLPRQDDLVGAFANTDSPINIVRGLFTQRGGFLKRLGSHIPIVSDYIDRNAFGITNFGNPDFTDIFKSGEPCQNIFSVTAPNKVDDGEIVADGQQIQISFDVFGRSPWDVIHIAKSLNPDALAGIRNFGLRQTVFMGMNRYYYAYDYARDKNTNTIVEKRKPFQQFHIYNSYQDIIQNGWVTSVKDMHTVAVGLYQNSGSFNSVSQEKIGPLYADIDIYPDAQRTMTYDTGLITKGIPYLGTITNSLFNNEYVEDFLSMFDIFGAQDDKGMVNNNQNIAWKMTASGLRQAVARMYAGDMIVVGDPSVNPLDRIYVYDEVNGIRGQAIVKEVSHMISSEGFTTAISPECIVTVDDEFENATHSIFRDLSNMAVFAVAATHSVCALKDSFKAVRTQAKEYWTSDKMQEKTFGDKLRQAKDDIVQLGKDSASTKKAKVIGKIKSVKNLNFKLKTKISKKVASSIFKTAGKGLLKVGSKLIPFAGEILMVAEFAMIRFNRFAKNLQVVKMYPLQRYGIPWTAGVNGQKGLVYGSRTANQQGLLESAINTVFGSGEVDSGFGIARGLKYFLIPEELQETADKYESNSNKDTEDAVNNANKTTDEYDKYKSGNRFANKVKSIMASNDGTNEQKTLSKTDYRQMQINQRADYDDPESIKASYDYFNMDTDQNWLASNKLKRNRLISKDVRLAPYIKEGFFKIIHETPGLNQGKNVKTSNVRFDGQDAYIKQIVETRQDGKNILDIPMLNPEALNILFELIRRAKNNMPAANASDPYENYEETKTSFIALESALRIADDKSVAGAGYTFILHGVDKAAPALAKAIKEFHEEIELDAKDNTSLNPVIFDSKDLGNNKTVISCRFPLIVQPKAWDDSGDIIKTNPEAENKTNKDRIGEQTKEERPSEIKKLTFDMEDMDGTSGLGLHQDIEESLLKLLK